MFIASPPPLRTGADKSYQRFVTNDILPSILPQIAIDSDVKYIDLFSALGGKDASIQQKYQDESKSLL